MADRVRPRRWLLALFAVQVLLPLTALFPVYYTWFGKAALRPPNLYQWLIELASHTAAGVVFYMLAKRLPLSGAQWRRNLALTAGSLIVVNTLRLLIYGVVWGHYNWRPITLDLAFFLRGYPGELIMYTCLAAAMHALVHYERLHSSEYRAQQLHAQMEAARLESVKARLQPHFLFNALNAVSSLIYSDPQRSRQVLKRLEQLLTDVIEPPQDMVPLRTEIDFIRRYLEFQGLRFGHRLLVTIDVEADLEDIPVPCLILLPIVENAIHHAVSAQAGARRLSVSAQRVNGAIRLEVTDDGPGLRSDWREGVGLSSIRERVAGHFGKLDALAIHNAPRGGTTASVMIPIHA